MLVLLYPPHQPLHNHKHICMLVGKSQTPDLLESFSLPKFEFVYRFRIFGRFLIFQGTDIVFQGFFGLELLVLVFFRGFGVSPWLSPLTACICEGFLFRNDISG